MSEYQNFDELENTILQCRKCPRLVVWREQVGIIKRRAFRDQVYWSKPVPGFGDRNAQVLVLGLAPGAHGSNRTGRMFTGDASGNFLYSALYKAGFANQSWARSREDGLRLSQLYITAICRCVPPGNKPTPMEITNCHGYLEAELELLSKLEGVVALGRLAYDAIYRIFYPGRNAASRIPFGHGAFVEGSGGKPWIMGSYHPSQQNTQTGKLTTLMFDQIWERVKKKL